MKKYLVFLALVFSSACAVNRYDVPSQTSPLPSLSPQEQFGKMANGSYSFSNGTSIELWENADIYQDGVKLFNFVRLVADDSSKAIYSQESTRTTQYLGVAFKNNKLEFYYNVDESGKKGFWTDMSEVIFDTSKALITDEKQPLKDLDMRFMNAFNSKNFKRWDYNNNRLVDLDFDLHNKTLVIFGDLALILHYVKNDTQFILFGNLELEGGLIAKIFYGFTITEGGIYQNGVINNYESEAAKTPEQIQKLYEKIYSSDNIDWKSTEAKVVYIEPKSAQKVSFAKNINSKNLYSEYYYTSTQNGYTEIKSELRPFVVNEDASFVLKVKDYDNYNSTKDITYTIVSYDNDNRAYFVANNDSYNNSPSILTFQNGVFGKSDYDNAIHSVIAIQNSEEAKKQMFIATINGAGLKTGSANNITNVQLAADGSFEKYGITYYLYNVESSTKANYSDSPLKTTKSINTITLSNGILFDETSGSRYMATTMSSVSELSAFANKINSKGLVYYKQDYSNGVYIYTTDDFIFDSTGLSTGGYMNGGSQGFRLLRVLSDKKVIGVDFSGNITEEYLTDTKLGSASEYNGVLEIGNMVMAVKPLNTLDPSQANSFKSAVAGTVCLYINGSTKEFTIFPDGFFILDGISYTFHNTRSATEGIFIDSNGKFIGVELIGETIYIRGKLGFSSNSTIDPADTFDTISWFYSHIYGRKY